MGVRYLYAIESHKDGILIRSKTEDGEMRGKIDGSFRPYLYAAVSSDEVSAFSAFLSERTHHIEGKTVTITATEQIKKTFSGDFLSVTQIFVAHPSHVPGLRQVIHDSFPKAKVWEYDVLYYKRYLLDRQLVPFSWYADDSFIELISRQDHPLSVLAFDIETVDEEIVMISFASEKKTGVITTKGGKTLPTYVTVVADERELLTSFVSLVRDIVNPDILTGYNTDRFDFPFLSRRAEYHKVPMTIGRNNEPMDSRGGGFFQATDVPGRQHIDLFPFIANILSRSLRLGSLKLHNVAQQLVGEGKDDLDWTDIKRIWNTGDDFEKLCAYSLQDARVTLSLYRKIFPSLLSFVHLLGQLPSDVARFSYGQMVEHYIFREAVRRNELIPSRPTQEEIGRRRSGAGYVGGYVREPKEGLYENLALLDFRSLYPSIVLAHNLSPETIDCSCCPKASSLPGSHHRVCRKRRGFIPSILEDLVAERISLKKEMQRRKKGEKRYEELYLRQHSLKILINAFYGYFAYFGARWYSKSCAEAITAIGRSYIQQTIKAAESQGFSVIYSDTDSLFLVSEDIKKKVPLFLEHVNGALPEGMSLELEDYFVRGLFTSTKEGRGAKKKYALLREDGSVKITGFERVRRDWSVLARTVQERVIRSVLENDVSGAVAEVKKTIQRLESGSVPLEELFLTRQLTRSPESYAVKAPHVMAARRAIERGASYRAGDPIKYLVGPGDGKISDRTVTEEFATAYDASYYISHQILPAALRILKVFGYTEDRILHSGRQRGLGRFMV